MRWLRSLWYARLRKIDMDILWPTCRDQAKNLDNARAAFAVHAMNDPAWMFLGEEAACQIIDGLK